MENSCNNCRFAKWQRGPSGRIRSKLFGTCLWQFPDEWKRVAKAKVFPLLSSSGIWRDIPHTDCPVWEKHTGTEGTIK